MTREDEIRARVDEILPGGWSMTEFDTGNIEIWHTIENSGICVMDGDDKKVNAEFIANAPSDIDYLLKENQRLRGALEEIREYERVVHAGSKSWSIANKALEGKSK